MTIHWSLMMARSLPSKLPFTMTFIGGAITYVGGSKTVGVGKHPLHVPAADFQILPAVLPLLLTLQPPSCPCRILGIFATAPQ